MEYVFRQVHVVGLSGLSYWDVQDKDTFSNLSEKSLIGVVYIVRFDCMFAASLLQTDL